jgi:hypothetical protein
VDRFFGRRAAYDAKSTYTGAHVGLGYRLKLNDASALKLYGQYLWSHQDGDTVTLTTGEPVKFKAIDSRCARLGAKRDFAVSNTTNFHAGAAWEHEYAGKAKATIHGYRLDTPELEGDTGVVELGVAIKPAQNHPLALDVAVQGYTRAEGRCDGQLKGELHLPLKQNRHRGESLPASPSTRRDDGWGAFFCKQRRFAPDRFAGRAGVPARVNKNPAQSAANQHSRPFGEKAMIPHGKAPVVAQWPRAIFREAGEGANGGASRR